MFGYHKFDIESGRARVLLGVNLFFRGDKDGEETIKACTEAKVQRHTAKRARDVRRRNMVLKKSDGHETLQ